MHKSIFRLRNDLLSLTNSGIVICSKDAASELDSDSCMYTEADRHIHTCTYIHTHIHTYTYNAHVVIIYVSRQEVHLHASTVYIMLTN